MKGKNETNQQAFAAWVVVIILLLLGACVSFGISPSDLWDLYLEFIEIITIPQRALIDFLKQ